jgi:outer membrane receptor protein involved in Fe transport
MTGGLRYTWDRTSGESIKSRYRFLTAIPLGPVTEETSPSVSSKAPTGMIEMEYKPVRDVMAYAKYVRGYRQGSVNMAAPTAFDTFKPEHVNTYEIGAKTTFRGPVPIRFNVAAFDNELTDMQLQTGVVSFAPTTIIFNAGKARIRGVEVEAFAELLTDLTLSLSYSHLDTKLLKQDDHRRDVLAAGFTPEQLAQLSLSGLIAFATYTPIADVGDSLPFAADNTVVASLSYRLPFPAAIGDVAIGATYAYTGKRRTAASSSSPNDILDPFELLNLNLNWTNIFGAPVDLAAFATNVLQEKYATYASGTYNTTGVDSRMVGLPRMIGARLKYRFGN